MSPLFRLLPFALLATACGRATESRTLDENAASVPEDLLSLEPEFFDTEHEFAAEGIALVRSPFDAPLLRGRDCARVQTQIEALKELRKRLEPEFDTAMAVATRTLPSGWCEANVASILTPYLSQTLWKRIDDTSVDVNCWGHALRAMEVLPALTALPAEGFTHALASQCRLVPQAEKPLPGDIVSIRGVHAAGSSYEFEEVHGAVWVSQDLWISKNGGARFVIEPAGRVAATYLEDTGHPECLQRSPDVPARAYLETCRSLFQVYRCDGFSATLAKAEPEIRPDVRSLVNEAIPFAYDKLHMQLAAVKDKDLGAGESYFADKPFDYIKAYFAANEEPMPREIKAYLKNLGNDAFLKARLVPVARILPALPTAFTEAFQARFPQGASLASGDGFGFFMESLGALHTRIHERLVANDGLSASERQALFTMLFMLAGSDGSSSLYGEYWTQERMPFSRQVTFAP